MFQALQEARFYVPGLGEVTGWEAIDDPVDLAARLGGEAYPAVQPSLIHRLANWTCTNRTRARRQVAAFLVNRFSASQERGGDRAPGGGSAEAGAGAYPFGDDLAAKVRKGTTR